MGNAVEVTIVLGGRIGDGLEKARQRGNAMYIRKTYIELQAYQIVGR